MPEINQIPMFFLGANSFNGFVSYFKDAYKPADGWRAYIIKGGPGTGKSTFMKKIARNMTEMGKRVELCPCSSDPHSLDAVIIPDIKAIIMDGTPPHVVEPSYPGVCETLVNFGNCWNQAEFEGKEKEIIDLYKENRLLHERASRYISAAGSLINDSYQIALECTNTAKATRFGTNIAKRLIPATGEKNGIEWKRFLSGITPLGLVFYRSTFEKLCDNTIIISDDYGAASTTIMSVIRSYALAQGYEIITCTCPFSSNNKYEHIIIPKLRLAFCTTNRYLQYENSERKIHARRFTDISALRLRKQRLTFNRRAVRELLEGAAEMLSEAKAVHDKIEKYYIKAMNFDKLAAVGNEVIRQLEQRAINI